MQSRFVALMIVLLVGLVWVGDGRALVVVRDLNVGNTGLGLISVGNVDVAAGADGILQFVFDSPNYSGDPSDDEVPYRTLLQRRLTADGVWHGEGRVDTTVDFDGMSTVVPLPDGFGFAWSTNEGHGRFVYRSLQNGADPAFGPVRYLVDEPTSGDMAAASLGDRVLIVWQDVLAQALVGWILTPSGTILNGFTIEPSRTAVLPDVTAAPGIGFVVGWFDFQTGESKVRPYTPDGLPLAAASVVMPDATFIRVAVGDDGVGAIAAIRPAAEGPEATVVVRRFAAASGLPIGNEIEVVTTDHLVRPDLRFDPSGNFFVVWGRDDNSSPLGVKAQAYGSDGMPLGTAVSLSNSIPYFRIRSSRLADGTFVNAWVNTFGFPLAQIISLCDPGSAMCGDGVQVSTCERCDDGAANSDTTPDACRTDCTRPRCGDGVTDGGESCDDGNTVSCDGCSASCAVETGLTCGDGVMAPSGCGETCDDGNAEVGDGCSPACALERIPGGGSRPTDCYIEWQVDNPANQPLLDKHGAFRAQQVCVDDNPRCDFDGGVEGTCTFHVAVCGNNIDAADCTTPSRLAEWKLDRPTAAQAVKKPTLAAIRDALQGTVPGAIVGPPTPDVCSAAADVVLPLRGSPGARHLQKVTLKAHATLYDGARDLDTLKLVCLPQP